jgi:predicted transcriptional regulator
MDVFGDTIGRSGGTVASAKQAVRDVLKQLPEDCTLEDVQYQLYLRQKLEKSRSAAAQGRLLPHEEVKKRLSKWLAK